MKYIVTLILASLCAGCLFEAQRALGCNNVGVFGCKDKVQPPNTDGPLPRRAEGRPSVLTNSRGERYYPGTPSWVPLIDNCMIAGGTRTDCIEALPPEELEKLEASEAKQGAPVPSHHSPLFKISPEPAVTRGVEATVLGLLELMRKK